MAESIRSVMLAGKGLLRWPGGEERVNYRMTVGLDSTIEAIRIGPVVPDILHRPSRHGRIYLHMPERPANRAQCSSEWLPASRCPDGAEPGWAGLVGGYNSLAPI